MKKKKDRRHNRLKPAAKGSGDNWLASRWLHTFTFRVATIHEGNVTAHFFRTEKREGSRVVADSKPTRSILSTLLQCVTTDRPSPEQFTPAPSSEQVLIQRFSIAFHMG